MADDSIEDKSAAARATLRAFDRFQDAEYNTAVARARTAKQFETFMDPDNVRLFPNLRWLASRSANPRAAHQAFYDRVWRKDDPFWSSHAPGTEWNCKCDVEETDDPVTENTDFEMPKAPRGLEGNPAQTGEVFTDNASYVANCSHTRKKKFEDIIGKKCLRKESIETLKTFQRQDTYEIPDIPEGVKIDSKTTGHISNDIAQSCQFWWNEVVRHLPSVLQKCDKVAHETNTKRDEKPSALEYYYYEYNVLGKKLYINIEENLVEKTGNHFYRVYAITEKVRETAIWYPKKER